MKHIPRLSNTSDINAAIAVSTPPYTSTTMVLLQLNSMPCYSATTKKQVSNWPHKQVCRYLHPSTSNRILELTHLVGYPIITIPIGTDTDGLPVSLSFQHTAWQERKLIKWASAVEDLILEVQGWRPTPQYRSFHSKNIPIDPIP